MKRFWVLLCAVVLALSICCVAGAEENAVKRFTLDSNGGVCYVDHQLEVKVDRVTPEGAAVANLVWSSSNEKVATVDANGMVTGVKRGTARITAEIDGTRIKASYNVTVKQAPTAITLSAKNLVMAEGKRERVTAQLEPNDCNDKRIEWTSSDPELCTVDKNGNIHCLAAGAVTITATSMADPTVSASIEITEEEPAKKVSFSAKDAQVKVGETTQLTWTVEPEGSAHSVTFSSNHEKIATVDENGVVTGVSAGRCTITCEAADGTRKAAHITVEVIQPVEGVTLKDSEVRVGVGNYVSLYAELSPKDATDKNMTWVSAEEVLATVTGDGLHAKVHGHAWGTTTVTGTTEDGSYSVTATVHVGSFAHALKVKVVKIHDGKPYLELENVSNLDITEVRYVMRGFDEQVHPINMSTHGRDKTYLYGTYEHELAPGEKTVHGQWSFQHPTDYEDLERLDFAVTGFTTADGFEYNMSESHWKWEEFDSDLYTQIQNNPRAN